MRNRFAAAAVLLGICTVVRPFPLDSLFCRGDSCLNVVWKPDSLNTKPDWYLKNGSLCTGTDTVYRHCDFIAGMTYRSIAYSYGGEDNYIQFREKLAKELLAGSHLCHYETVGDPSPYVAGTDCSGFACYVWNVPRESTAGLAADPKFQKVAKTRLQAGDLMVKAGSHAVVVVESDDSTHYVIWESTSAVNGCRERAVDISETVWDPYVGLRNPDIVWAARPAGPASGTIFNGPLRVFAARGGRQLNLLFTGPLSGEIFLYDAAGRRLLGAPFRSASDRLDWTLPAPLAAGIYVVLVRPVRGSPYWERFSAVR